MDYYLCFLHLSKHKCYIITMHESLLNFQNIITICQTRFISKNPVRLPYHIVQCRDTFVYMVHYIVSYTLLKM